MQRYTSRSLLRAASAQATGTVYSSQRSGKGTPGMAVTISVTGSPTGALVATIERYNVATGTWDTVLASASLSGAGNTVLRVDPRSAAVANQIAQEIAPKQWRLKGVVTGGSVTWGASVIWG